MDSGFWKALLDSIQLIASFAVVIGIPIAIWQLYIAVGSRRLEAIARVFEDFRTEFMISGRRYVYSHAVFDYDQCSGDERAKLDRIITTFNRISYLVSKRMIRINLLLDLWSGAYAGCWEKCVSYIKRRREVSGFGDWAAYFEEIAAKCIKYRKEKLGEKGTGYHIPND